MKRREKKTSIFILIEAVGIAKNILITITKQLKELIYLQYVFAVGIIGV